MNVALIGAGLIGNKRAALLDSVVAVVDLVLPRAQALADIINSRKPKSITEIPIQLFVIDPSTWTPCFPLVPGFYFQRDSRQKELPPVIGRVFEHNPGGPLFFNCKPVTMWPDHEWAGPIQEPYGS